MLEDTLERKAAPSLALLAEHGRYRRAISTFPSLTPVCLSALATGAHPDVHEIPHLVWYHRGEKRLVEYGSSFGAVRAAGDEAVADRHDLRAQRQPPRQERRDLLRGAGGRRADRRGREHHLLPRPRTSTARRSLPDAPGPRPEPVLLLQPVRVGHDRRAAVGAQPAARIDRRVHRRRRPLARDAGRLRLPRLLPLGLRLRVARPGAGCGARRARPLRRGRRHADRGGRRCRTSSSSATPSFSAPTTARRP